MLRTPKWRFVRQNNVSHTKMMFRASAYSLYWKQTNNLDIWHQLTTSTNKQIPIGLSYFSDTSPQLILKTNKQINNIQLLSQYQARFQSEHIVNPICFDLVIIIFYFLISDMKKDISYNFYQKDWKSPSISHWNNSEERNLSIYFGIHLFHHQDICVNIAIISKKFRFKMGGIICFAFLI